MRKWLSLKSMKIALVQMNSTVGDFEGNIRKIRQALERARGADLVVFPESAITGYPQQDLLDYPSFADRASKAAAELIRTEGRSSFVVGSVEKNDGPGKPYRNIALFAHEGRVIGKYFKRLLPTYDVFDEDRFFEPGREALLIDFKGEKIAVTICEDIWNEAGGVSLENRYHQKPLADSKGASLILNISASPFEYAKVKSKRDMLASISQKYEVPFVYVNAVGANDQIIFDGRSYVWSAKGEMLAEGKAFDEDLIIVDTEEMKGSAFANLYDESTEIYEALVLGIKDYCAKQNFDSVLLGLSGGIDSAVVACLAADAIGPENVVGVLMPSRFTSAESNQDAIALAKAMQNPIHLLPIEEVFQASLRTLSKAFEGLDQDVTEENLQSRARGILLMGLSNKFNHLLLTTGNKSELAVGYCTLYGDMCGGLAPLSDVYKGQVYALGREANRRSPRIPERVFEKAPTAELRANQSDQDTLPPYERLDAILKAIIEKFSSKEDLVAAGFDSAELDQIFNWIRKAEYKRFQMPLGLKVSPKAFGRGRRMPIVHRFS